MLNIGFIGCGGIARHHASRLARIRGARILATADVVADAAQGFARDFGAHYHTDDYRRILDRPELDAVWICPPTFQHPAPVIAAAKAGKHVFCEKPMALNMADARRMVRACDTAGVRLTIGFVRRFDARAVIRTGGVLAAAGATIAARHARVPVLLDGFACSAAAATLFAVNGNALDHCLVAHNSVEPGHTRLLKEIGQQPLLDFSLRLGEGSGAALAAGIVRAAAAVHNGMATFTSAGVSGPAD